MSKTQARSLAYAIAEALADTESLGRYVVCCEKYPERFIRKALETVNATPGSQIKKPRAALFFYLVKQYAHQKN